MDAEILVRTGLDHARVLQSEQRIGCMIQLMQDLPNPERTLLCAFAGMMMTFFLIRRYVPAIRQVTDEAHQCVTGVFDSIQ